MTRESMYDARATAGVFPSAALTWRTARLTARALRLPAPCSRARAVAAITVAAQVRNSLAEYGPSAQQRSALFTSGAWMRRQPRAGGLARYTRSSSGAPRRRRSRARAWIDWGSRTVIRRRLPDLAT